MAFIGAIGAAITGAAATSATAAVVGTIATGAMAMGAMNILGGVMGGGGGKGASTPAVAPLPTTPDPAASLTSAQEAADTRRRTILASGGQTIQTSPQGSLLGLSNIQKKTLLGS